MLAPCWLGTRMFVACGARGSSVDRVFSSATSSINGQKNIQLQFSFSRGGTAILIGESRGSELHLVSLKVSAAGQVVDVAVGAGDPRAGGDRGGSWAARSGGGDGEIIDVESWSSSVDV